MAHANPKELPIEETVRFLEAALPKPPCRVLEVGCGSGAVAARLAGRGYHVTGLDASAEAIADCRARGVQAVEGDFLSYRGGEPVDALLFTRSLHHIDSPARAAERAHALLKPGGRIVAEEFAIERMDNDTARWFYELRSLLEAAGVMSPDPAGEPLAATPLDRWFQDHEPENPVHAGEDMLMALGTRFELDRVVSTPYLYRYVCERVEASDRGARVAHWVFELESLRIVEATLRPVGLRVVGHRAR
ncbi:MAG TPA: class I SAM-dependent methyltransferase [Candidatus Eisenbacteria bacterium]|jgi:SAM-dependent methyltransferase